MPVTAVRTAVPAGRVRPSGPKVSVQSVHTYAFIIVVLRPSRVARVDSQALALNQAPADDLAGRRPRDRLDELVAAHPLEGRHPFGHIRHDLVGDHFPIRGLLFPYDKEGLGHLAG